MLAVLFGGCVPASPLTEPTLVVSPAVMSAEAAFTITLSPEGETGRNITQPLNQVEITNHTDQEIQILSLDLKGNRGGIREIPINRTLGPQETGCYFIAGEYRKDIDPVAAVTFAGEDDASVTKYNYDSQKTETLQRENPPAPFLFQLRIDRARQNDGYGLSVCHSAGEAGIVAQSRNALRWILHAGG